MNTSMKRLLVSIAGILVFSQVANAQVVTPLTVKDGNANSQTLCQYKPDGTNLAGCTVKYVWNGASWVLEAVGAGTASGTARSTVAQDTTTIAGSAPGTAGTPSSQVLTVQGATGITPLATSQAAGAIVDLGTGPSPAANTTNNYLQTLATGAAEATWPTGSGSVPINIATATTTQLVALSAGKSIYILHWDVIAGGTGTIQLEYGTGVNCGTGTTVLTGAYPLAAQAGVSNGNGGATLFIAPSGNALCAITVGAVQYSGQVSYVQR